MLLAFLGLASELGAESFVLQLMMKGLTLISLAAVILNRVLMGVVVSVGSCPG